MSSPIKRKSPEDKPAARQASAKRQRRVHWEEKAADLPSDEEFHENDDVEDPNDEQNEEEKKEREGYDSDSEDSEDSDADSDASSVDDNDDANAQPGARKLKKRNDPSVFATSISKILASKVAGASSSASKSNSTHSTRTADPVLARSKSAAAATKEISTSRLEEKAKRKIREEKRSRKDKGRIADVLGLSDPMVSTKEILEREKRYKKIAQRGVVMLFNAIRNTQRQAESLRDDEDGTRIVDDGRSMAGLTRDAKEERVSEMSKKGFLELIAGGGKK